MPNTALNTARVWYRESGPRKPYKPVNDAKPTVSSRRSQGGIQFDFVVPLGEGEATKIAFEVNRKDFAQLFEAMVRAGGRCRLADPLKVRHAVARDGETTL